MNYLELIEYHLLEEIESNPQYTLYTHTDLLSLGKMNFIFNGLIEKCRIKWETA